MDWHKYALMFPRILGEARAAMRADIKEQGVKLPVLFIMDKGKKIGVDGRNRWELCEELKIECPTERVFWEEKDILANILSLNRHHRSPNAGVRKLAKLLEKDGFTQRDISAKLRVSLSTVNEYLSGKTTKSVRSPNRKSTFSAKNEEREPGDETEKGGDNEFNSLKNGRENFNFSQFSRKLGEALRMVNGLAAEHGLVDNLGAPIGEQYRVVFTQLQWVHDQVKNWSEQLKGIANDMQTVP